MRLFLDANILFLAGYSAASPVHDLLALAASGDCELLSSEYAFEEARRNLALKSPDGSMQQFEAATATIIRVQEARGVALEQAQSAKLSDVSDIPILAAALQCGADALVTGDRRAFGSFFGRHIQSVRILRLRDALTEILADR
ncbi:MAG: PIN domain-containing protein [Gemmataceae bacterium]